MSYSDVRRRVAFFDVDETLITAKSMFDFLRFWLDRNGDDGSYYWLLSEQRRTRAASGVPREEINRDYYRQFAGVAKNELWAAGLEWYRDYKLRPDAFIGATLAAAAEHRAAGDAIVMVSGSFRACLAPLAADLGATEVLCSEPIADENGILTGEIARPMIGDAKADAVTETVARMGVSALDCYAYGDHSSDLKMLLAVGQRRVVGDNPVLLAKAHTHGWPILSAAPVPFSLAAAV